MQGILGALGRDYDDPRTQGLLTLGLQLLASRQPKFGQALGEAGLGAMQAYEGARAGQQQRKAAQLQQQAQEMQLQRLRQEQERAVRQEEGRARYLADMSGNMGPPPKMNPWQALAAGIQPAEMKMLQGPAPAAPMKPMVLPDGTVLSGDGRQVIREGPRASVGGRIGVVSPEAWTPESLAKYQQGGDPSVLRRFVASPQRASGPTPLQLAEAGGETQLDLAKRFGKPAAGFRWKADGTMEPIPGGPADRRNTEAGIREQRSRDAAIAQADRVIGKVDQAMDSTGLFSAGPAARVLNLPGTPARDLQATLDTIKANLGFAELQAMRDASPTGGALGAIAVQELIALQATVASLEQTQSPEQLKKSLGQIRGHYMRWKDVVNRARQEDATQGVGAEPPAPVRVNNDADFDALPSGATFIAPDGSLRRKP